MTSARAVLLLVLALAACSGRGPATPGDGPGGGDDGRPGDGPAGLEPGTLQVSWMHGSASCAQDANPEVQVHAYNATTHVIRQNKCDNFEAPFIYVLVGATSALVLDTGATTTATLRNTVRGLVGTRALIVAHSEGGGAAGRRRHLHLGDLFPPLT
jgi:hypothetical protein